MLTGTGTEAREKQAGELGVTELLAKGFSIHELGEAVNLVVLPTDQDRKKRARRA